MEKKTTKGLVNCIALVIFLAYLALGVGIYRDYGISADEPTERLSTLVNVKYVFNFLGIDRMNGFDIPDLETYSDRNYGTFLQMPSVLFEMKAQDLGDVFFGRHLYTFLLCMLGYAAFFFLIKALFSSTLTGVLGVFMVALYPRFFAEQFYNIKDMVFVSTFMICMLTTVKLIKSRFSVRWMIIFAISVAISTNVRIVGVIFLFLVLGYLLIDYIMGKTMRKTGYEVRCIHPFVCSASMLLIWFVAYVATLPVTWKNPLRGVWEVFSQFSQYDNWDSTIVFMGNVITKDQLPWYYVPIWMLISVPIWYLLLAAAAAVAGIVVCVRRIRNKEGFWLLLVTRYKYVVWCVLLMAVPWLGTVVMHSTLYNGWRHCYFLLPPLVLLAMFGVEYLVRKGRRYYIPLLSVIILGISLQVAWIWNNHPHEMVYFNNIGKYYGAQFDRDYWHLTTQDAFRYIAQNETNDTFSVEAPGNDFYKYLLNEEERSRIVEEENPLYYIETYRGKTGNELEIEGYEEIYSFVVDDFKIASVYKRCEGDLD